MSTITDSVKQKNIFLKPSSAWLSASAQFRGQRRYSGSQIPLENVSSLVHGSIKFDELRVRSTLLLGSALRCHSEIVLRSDPLSVQILVRLLLVENHILVSNDLAIFGIPEPINVLISSISNEDAPLGLWVQLAPVS